MEINIATITIFILAIFVGFEIITKVPPTLHTPLMSGSNAISGITLDALFPTSTVATCIEVGKKYSFPSPTIQYIT